MGTKRANTMQLFGIGMETPLEVLVVECPDWMVERTAILDRTTLREMEFQFPFTPDRFRVGLLLMIAAGIASEAGVEADFRKAFKIVPLEDLVDFLTECCMSHSDERINLFLQGNNRLLGE